MVFCRPRGQLGTCSAVSQIGSTRSCWDNSSKHPTHKKGVCVSKSKYFTNQFHYFPWQRDQFLNFTNISAIKCVADVEGNFFYILPLQLPFRMCGQSSCTYLLAKVTIREALVHEYISLCVIYKSDKWKYSCGLDGFLNTKNIKRKIRK